MAHPRKTIVAYVVTLLTAANTAAGSRVVSTRVEKHKKSGIPSLAVYALDDPEDDSISSEMEVGHEINLEIAGWVAHTDAVPADVAANNLAEQVEIAMRADEYLGGNASHVLHKGTKMQVVEDNAGSDPLVGIVVLTYAVTYHIALAAT